MLGKPKYKYGDLVQFQVDNNIKIGVVKIIDAYGTFFQIEESSYDLEVQKENCLYKHIRESRIEGKEI